MSYEPCPECDGKGWMKDILGRKEECYLCHGKGKVFYEPELKEEIESPRAYGDSQQDWIGE